MSDRYATRHLAPPDRAALAHLGRRVAAVTARRLRRVAGAHGVGTALGRRVAEVRETLAALPAAARRRHLCGPDLRGFLSEAEIWIDVLRLAAGPRPDVARLFSRISGTEHLLALVPAGRLDAAFPARARALARRRLGVLTSDLGAFLLGLRLATRADPGRLEVALAFGASAEQGRPRHRIDLGTFATPAGPLGLRAPARDGRVRDGRLRARIEGRVLTLRSPGLRPIVVPAAGSPLASAVPILERRRTIPGSPILLAPALRPGRGRLGVGRDVPGLAGRLARALRLVRLAWPEMHRDVVARTAMVVPVREPGLVSYSLAARPGISFINVHGKPTLTLADDLVHENAHHLLHDVQEVVRLLAPGPDTTEVQAFASPWRGTLRPLHGILHGVFTFLFRAELFIRVAEARARWSHVVGPLLGRGGEAFLRREIRREIAMLCRGLADLETAAAHRLLTPQGRALVTALGAWHARLRRRAAARPSRGGR
jgi:HEXXH motif-containing protein